MCQVLDYACRSSKTDHLTVYIAPVLIAVKGLGLQNKHILQHIMHASGLCSVKKVQDGSYLRGNFVRCQITLEAWKDMLPNTVLSKCFATVSKIIGWRSRQNEPRGLGEN